MLDPYGTQGEACATSSSGAKPLLQTAVVVAQVDVIDHGSFVEGNSLPFGDLVERTVDCG